MINSSSAPYPTILKDASSRQLEQAVAHNHHELFCLNAIAQGGELRTGEGLTVAYNGPGKAAMVSFPSMNEEGSGKQLDEMMDFFRMKSPKNAGCWSLIPTQPTDLGVKLLARGFQPGWHPCWMGLDLGKIIDGHSVPRGLKITADNLISVDKVKDLPYSGDNGAISGALMQAYPGRATRFIATLNKKIVAHSCVFLVSGTLGSAGIYNVGVVPKFRNQGIGKAVVIAACLYAREKGYRYAVLNATGRKMYEQIGFEWIGDGITWWLMNQNYRVDPPARIQVMIAEAAGKGDIGMLDQLAKDLSSHVLNVPTTNGMTLLQLAVHCRQPLSVAWLVNHGASYDVLDAWDIGWKEQAADLLKTDPRQVNKQYTDWQTTLLHIAADRNDIALAELVISAKPDLSIRDKIYNNTAAGWAKYLQRKEIVALIEDYKNRLRV